MKLTSTNISWPLIIGREEWWDWYGDKYSDDKKSKQEKREKGGLTRYHDARLMTLLVLWFLLSPQHGA